MTRNSMDIDRPDAGSTGQALHVPSLSGDDHEVQRPLISPATIVNIKHKLGKSRHVPQASASALEEWKYVRGPKRSSDAGLHGLDGASSGFSVRPPRDPRTSVASSSFGANLVQEPASYAKSPVPSPGLHQNGDVEYDSDDSHSGDEYAHFTKRRANKRTSQIFLPQEELKPQSTVRQRLMDIFRLPALTAVQRGVIKCCIAYFVATLFTFVPWLSDLFAAPFDVEGPVSGAHVIATVSTYYNPAKTLGASKSLLQ